MNQTSLIIDTSALVRKWSVDLLWAVVVWGALATLSGCRHAPVIKVEKGLVIRNTTLISSERTTPLEKATVVMQGDSILYVGNEPIQLSGTYRILEGEGKYLIPGLIDSHVHVSNMLGMGP